MKFVVSSTELLNHLTAISKVISSKNTMPVLDNFLFQLAGAELTITASDLESTLITSMELDNVEGEGVIAVPAKLLIDTLKEFPEQPLTFQIDTNSFSIEIYFPFDSKNTISLELQFSITIESKVSPPTNIVFVPLGQLAM